MVMDAYPLVVARSEPAKPTPFEKFEEATKRLPKVSKMDVEKAELRRKKEKEAREAEGPTPGP
jgi:hypothetical protein